jgi:predicted double-glycine peptidase
MRASFLLANFGRLLLCAGVLAWAGAARAEKTPVQINASGASYSLHVMSFRDIPFRTVIRQQYDYSCGSASLATLLHYHYGRPVGEAEIFKSMYEVGDQERIRKVGFSLLDMKQYLARQGFQADGYRMTLDTVQKTGVPGIAVITAGPFRHFVVVKGVQNGKVLIGDPVLGLKTYTRAEFEQMWTGIIFLIHGEKNVKGDFNVAAEWRPWATPPLGTPMDSESLFGLTATIPTIYQVMQ